MNQITHWLDASNIYGSTLDESNSLRSFSGGKLKSNSVQDSRGLPSCSKTPDIEMCHRCSHCFAAGRYSIAIDHCI